MEVTIEQEVANVSMGAPHVVILGAGASRATCPGGDKNGKKLPLMTDFSEIVGIANLLRNWNIDPYQNFEDTFSLLYENKETEKLITLQEKTEEYFKNLELPDTPTIYDHLVLSLREKDVIATFNWDPLLVQAYLRSRKAGLPLPKLIFLHGNIAIGYCAEHHVSGLNSSVCSKCNKRLTPTKLLYPIKKKNYKDDHYIKGQWEMLQSALKSAFMITIFGYSGPKSDQEAIKLMKKAWGDIADRSMEQTSFITIDNKDVVAENWDQFIHTHHCEIQNNFYDSWIANHPRRTGEAYFNQYYEALFVTNNPIPQNLSFPELRQWYCQFIDAEDESD